MTLIARFFLWDQNLSKRPLLWEWILITFASAIFFWIKFKGVAIMAPDSFGYVDFSPLRTMGYPSFLFLIHEITNDHSLVPLIQLLFYYGGVLWVSINFSRFFNTYFGGAIFLILFIFNVEIIKNCFYILTESLSTSIVLFIIAILIKFTKKPTISLMISISLFVGLSIFVRPSSYSYLSLIFLIPFFYFSWFKKNFILKLLSIIGPMAAVFILSGSIQYFKNGFFASQSFLGLNLIGKVLLVAREDSPSSEPAVMKEIDHFASPIRSMIEETNSLQFKYILVTNYYDQLRYNERHRLERVIKDDSIPPGTIFCTVALDAIKAQPILYAKDVCINFYALLFLSDLVTCKENMEFQKILKKHTPLPYIKELPFRPRTDSYKGTSCDFLIWALRLTLGLAFLSSVIATGTSIYQRFQKKEISSVLIFSCFSGVLVHTHYLLVSLLQSGIPRYALVIWPAVFASMLAFIVWCRDVYLKNKKGGTHENF